MKYLLRKVVLISIIGYIIFSMGIAPVYSQMIDQKQMQISTMHHCLRTIIVPDDYPTIQGAINHASNGDTILVRPGTYKENINVNKMLTIHGEGMDLTSIIGVTSTDHTVTISSDGVEISSFTIQNSGTNKGGIYASSHYNTFKMNSITKNDYGIILDASNGNRILDNNIINNQKDGVWMDSSHMNELSGNNISNNQNDGLKIDFTSTFNEISGNIASKNQQNGVLINDASRSNTVAGNKVAANTVGVKCVGTSDNNRFYQNDFHKNVEMNAFDTSSDVWNRSGMGNHWSDFDEPSEGAYDDNEDGLIDSHYMVPGGDNRDTYPLVASLSPAPPLIEGPTSVQAGTRGTYHISSPSPVYGEVYYQIYWGNGDYWETTDTPIDTSAGTDESHVWAYEVTYNVRARAFVEIEGVRIYSEESEILPVTVPKKHTNELPKNRESRWVLISKSFNQQNQENNLENPHYIQEISQNPLTSIIKNLFEQPHVKIKSAKEQTIGKRQYISDSVQKSLSFFSNPYSH